MEIFLTVKKHLAALGYVANQNAFNVKQLGFIFMGVVSVQSLSIYLFCYAHAQKEYMDIILMITATVLGKHNQHNQKFVPKLLDDNNFSVTISMVSTVQKTATIFTFINRIEEIVNDSEFE